MVVGLGILISCIYLAAQELAFLIRMQHCFDQLSKLQRVVCWLQNKNTGDWIPLTESG